MNSTGSGDGDPAPLLFIVGEVEATSEWVIAATDHPGDATEVWLETAPTRRVTLAALDDDLGEGAIMWDTEPEPWHAEDGGYFSVSRLDDGTIEVRARAEEDGVVGHIHRHVRPEDPDYADLAANLDDDTGGDRLR